MKKIYHLSSCSTCVRIIKELGVDSSWELQNIKTEKITTDQLDEMVKLAGSYDALFSRRSMKYKSMGLKDKALEEEDYKSLILEEYTFLKRPVILFNDKIFIGNSKKVVEQANQEING